MNLLCNKQQTESICQQLNLEGIWEVFFMDTELTILLDQEEALEEYCMSQPTIDYEVVRQIVDNTTLRVPLPKEQVIVGLKRQDLQVNDVYGLASLEKEEESSVKPDSYWKDLYYREVEGLNNEGDPIGGEPACGLRQQVEALRKEIDELKEKLLALNSKPLVTPY